MTALPDRRLSTGGRPAARLARRLAYREHRAQVDARMKSTFLPGPYHMERNQSAALSVVTESLHNATADDADLRARIRAIAEDDDSYSQARIAKEAGISGTTLSQWLGGTYGGNNANTEGKLRVWLEQYELAQANGGLPVGPEWVETPIAKKIIGGLRYAQLAGDIVLIYGAAGVGKSKSMVRYMQSAPNVFYVEMSPATGSLLSCLEEIAIGIGLRDYTRHAAGLMRAICARLRGTNGLLILDEAQQLGLQALDQVRSIHDKTGIGLALVGNERVYTQMAGSNRAAFLDRLFSRVGKRIHLKHSSDADADAYVKAWGIDDAGCKARVRDIARRPGALRTLGKVLRMAAAQAQAENRAMCCDDIQAVWRELGGLDG